MASYIAIFPNNRIFPAVDYELDHYFALISPDEIIQKCERGSEVVIHARDIRGIDDLRTQIFAFAEDKENDIKLYFFTQDSEPSRRIENHAVHSWPDIVRYHKNLPSLDRKSFDKIINLYPLCLGYLDAHPYAESVRGPLTETAIANRGLTESVNWWTGVLGNDLKGIDLNKELSELKEDENVVDNLSSLIKAIDSAPDDSSRETAVNVLTQTVEKLKGLCHKLEKSGRLL